MSKPRYHGAVWIDFLHNGRVALNVVEVDEYGHPIGQAIRVRVLASVVWAEEADIVDHVLPGAVYQPIRLKPGEKEWEGQ